MTTIAFYAKPGCKGNAAQVRALRASGHTVHIHDLLTEPWTAETLGAFFGDTPPGDWFNRSATRVKAGEIDPDALSANAAMTALLADPLLIRRPLMAVNGVRRAGWDAESVDRWIGLSAPDAPSGEGCAAAADAHQ